MIHVITPFSRLENVPALYAHLKGQGMQWHPLPSGVSWPGGYDDGWIRPFPVAVADGVDPFCYKLTAFARRGPVVADDWYGVLNDDDMYGEGVLEAVAASSARVVVVSMLRGDATPDSGWRHPTSPLVAAPENMRVGHIGVEQYFVRGAILREMTFPVDCPACCDGLAAEWLYDHYLRETEFRPDVFVLFNRLEPGRWAVDYDESFNLLPA